MGLDPGTPVLVGYGQVNQQDVDPDVEPVDLVVASARAAAIRGAVDSARVVSLLSWRYRDPGLLVAQRIRALGASTHYSGIGGDTPLGVPLATERIWSHCTPSNGATSPETSPSERWPGL